MTSTQIATIGTQVIGWKLVLKNVVYCQGGCTWSTAFGNTVWNGTDGTLTFASDTLTGFNVNVSSVDPSVNSVSKWECLSTTYFSTDGILLLKSTQVFKHTNGLHMAYLCLTLKDVSSPDAYYFYRTHAQTPSLNNERIKISQTGSFTTQGQICGDVPPVHEFHYMVKQGKELTSRQFCPPSLLAKMDYNVTSAGGANSCTSSVDDWDVCTNKTEMVFNYTTCATQMLYSSAGKVYCMFNMTATNDYAIVYVEDNQFICVVSNTAGTAASFVGGHCGQTDHTPTSFAKQGGVDVGFTVTMTAKDAVSAGIGSCPVNSINGAFVIEKSTPPDAVSAGIGSRPVSSINGTLNKDALPEMSVEE
ncbi:uncharacterized protein LOC127849643 [Dreissena polymorpha]|uniref:uncharacterized protein LOC127849643 n=1 Tax=Dreissena polymorpha TaxID=45954 RepID=UPI002264452C|nr:uncharacterized protein LOC127849643 [Dreissena polymorpha]